MLRYVGLGLLGLFLWGVFTTLTSVLLAIVPDRESKQLMLYIAQLVGLAAAAWIVVKLNSQITK